MAKGCPARTALEAFATDNTPGWQRDELEAHLSLCLACAEEIDAITCAQLTELIGNRPSRVAAHQADSPALAVVMRRATEGSGAVALVDPDDILAVLDAPSAKGALGSFAGYDIIEIVGRGGMGVVFKARDHTLDRFVAIKVIFPMGQAEDPVASRFLDEARAVAAIQHDHIVVVHHAGMAKGLPYLVMPFHPEGTLEAQLERRPKLAPIHVARVGLQLARALAATHARGILHRDIKPSNVLMEDSGERVRLSDFGLARTRDLNGPSVDSDPPSSVRSGPTGTADNLGSRHIRPHAGSRTIAGTPHYMSPEQARGEGIDARSDLFSLGAVLFQMTTGQGLYSGESPREVIGAAARCELRSARAAAPELPRALAALIDRLLARRPEDRFASASAVASELERIVEPGGWARRWMKRAAAVLVVCVAAVGSIVGLDASGRTAIINSIWSQQTGRAYFVRGKFGTYARISDAVAGARSHDVIEVRFSGERLTESFRVGGKPLTIRAARGFMPIMVATNNAQPLILVDAPLTLEGITLWRRGPVVNFAALTSVENAPLNLLNCRLLRSGHQGQNIVARGRLRLLPGAETRRYRALLAFEHGSMGKLQNCVVAGTAAAGICVRSAAALPTHVGIHNSLVAINCGIFLNAEAETGVSFTATGSVFVNEVFLDVSRPTNLHKVSVSWRDSILDRTQGTFVRLGEHDPEQRLRGLSWTESNVVYAGQGGFAMMGLGTAVSEADWNQAMQLRANSHQHVEGHAFAETCFRSCLTLSVADLEEAIVKLTSGSSRLAVTAVGEGASYDRFRRTEAYRQWQREVRASALAWEQRNPKRAIE